MQNQLGHFGLLAAWLAGRRLGLTPWGSLWSRPTSPKPPQTRSLSRHEVQSLPGQPVAGRLLVQAGTIWLTATPAAGDILLQAGEEYPLPQRTKVVIEALSEACVTIRVVEGPAAPDPQTVPGGHSDCPTSVR
ncbi:MAG TPA: DUF2917 domain-containing protein [Verrucomicrobiae bacterium]